MRFICIFFIINYFSLSVLNAEVKECYQQVNHVLWVVNELEPVIESWKELGFTDFKTLEKAELRTDDKYIEVKAVATNLAGSKVIWLQPVRGRSFLTDVLEDCGPGVCALIHSFDSRNDMKSEIERLHNRRIDVKWEFTLKASGQELDYTVMQTKEDGKYNIGFVDNAESEKLFKDMDGTNKYGLSFNQYAFATSHPKEVSKFWSRFGLPKMDITHTDVHDKEYYSKKAEFDMELGWQRHGEIVYEWCIPLKEPNVYQDHIAEKGEGFHHFGFKTENMEQSLNFFIEKGFVVSQSGGWGEKGKPGSGKFAYIDPNPLGGVAVELLWSYKE